jgi:hypothetical protein
MNIKRSGNIAIQKSLILTEIREIFIILVFASTLPMLVHLIPWHAKTPIGATWLPIFYAPLVGIILFRPRAGIIAGILAPALNAVITGRPDVQIIYMLTAELVIFTTVASLIYTRYKSFFGTALIAYVAAKFSSSVILGIIPHFAESPGRIGFFLMAVRYSIPGLAILTLVNWLTITYKEKKANG